MKDNKKAWLEKTQQDVLRDTCGDESIKYKLLDDKTKRAGGKKGGLFERWVRAGVQSERQVVY